MFPDDPLYYTSYETNMHEAPSDFISEEKHSTWNIQFKANHEKTHSNPYEKQVELVRISSLIFL